MIDFANVLGTEIIYQDYLGIDHKGIIGWCEPYYGPQDDSDKMVVWIYVVDDDPELNIHEFYTAENKCIMYAEVRLSTEVSLLDDE